ncbi:hypothetical protein PBY51_015328 [Eleginops maclovinus]|uniref:Uncharacterized protein n=1 Tax=Eleginops maclovinus TaxID=56733 RepID=A0AAN7X2E5_ELEMC|nr:hypothetical protein PBY51_015328 [Eleginops maclovinus]
MRTGERKNTRRLRMSFTSAALTSDSMETDGARSGHLYVSLPACLRVRGTYEPGWVLSIPRGCLISCLSAFH